MTCFSLEVSGAVGDDGRKFTRELLLDLSQGKFPVLPVLAIEILAS